MREDGNEVEQLLAVFLGKNGEVRGEFLISRGTEQYCDIRPAWPFVHAQGVQATSIILLHNHPSGDPNPSLDDLRSTRELARIGSSFRIRLYDHIIVTETVHFSFRDAGLL